MTCCKPCRAHWVQLVVSVALLVSVSAITGCRKEKASTAESEAPSTEPSVPPATPSPAPFGVFVHKDIGQSSDGSNVEFYSILRFSKDGQVCSLNVSRELDDEILSRYSKRCDAHDKDFEYGTYTFVNGTITFSIGQSDYSGNFNSDRLILSTVYRPTQRSSTDEYRHYDVPYDSQEPAPAAQ